MTEARAIAYMQARQKGFARQDAARSKSGKRSGKIKCIPPNKKCGDRCIPPNWNCRITGGGLDSHSRVVEFDPVKGVGGIVRGVKNIEQGYRKRDPELIARGVKGIERGVTKLTPGNNIEEKQRFRKRLRKVANAAFIIGFGTVASLKTHELLKNRVASYRNGLGARIDRSALNAMDTVAESWDRAVANTPLSGFGTGRTQTALAGQASAERLARLARAEQTIAGSREARLGRMSGYLAGRAGLRSTEGMSRVHNIDKLARDNGWSYEKWQAEKTKAFIGLNNQGRSIFSVAAAQDQLAWQWGYQNEHRSTRTAGQVGSVRLSETRLKSFIADEISKTHASLTADMKRRRITDINDYANTLFLEQRATMFGASRAGLDRETPEMARIRHNFTDTIKQIMVDGGSTVKARSMASKHYSGSVRFYDEYFREAAGKIDIGPNGRVYNPNAVDSPYAPAVRAMARVNARHRSPRAGSPRVANGSVANFINKHHYETTVQRKQWTRIEPPSAIQYAFGISGRRFTDPNAALSYLRSQRYKVSFDPIPKPKNRSDARDNVGKPCGGAYISPSFKCHVGNDKPGGIQADKPNPKDQAKATVKLVADVGFVGAMGLVSAAFGYMAYDSSKKHDPATTGYAVSSALFAAAAILKAKNTIQDKQDTLSTEQLNKKLDTLKTEEGVEPETVEQLQQFIQKADIDVKPVHEALRRSMNGYFDPVKPNRLFVSRQSGHNAAAIGGPTPTSLTQGVKAGIKYRAQLPPEDADLRTVKGLDKLVEGWSASGYVRNPEARHLATVIHEAAHALHYRNNWNSATSVTVNGKKYEGEALTKELVKATSYYGQVDLHPRPERAATWSRRETFAENYLMYVANGATMKQQFPVAYEWTKQTAANAYKQPAKVKPFRINASVVAKLVKASNTIDSMSTRRKDADPEHEAKFLVLLGRMQDAATKGDIQTATQILAQAGGLADNERAILGSLVETTAIYSS